MTAWVPARAGLAFRAGATLLARTLVRAYTDPGRYSWEGNVGKREPRGHSACMLDNGGRAGGGARVSGGLAATQELVGGVLLLASL